MTIIELNLNFETKTFNKRPWRYCFIHSLIHSCVAFYYYDYNKWPCLQLKLIQRLNTITIIWMQLFCALARDQFTFTIWWSVGSVCLPPEMPIHNNQETKKRNEERSEICIFPLKKEEQQEENLKRKEYKYIFIWFDWQEETSSARTWLALASFYVFFQI